MTEEQIRQLIREEIFNFFNSGVLKKLITDYNTSNGGIFINPNLKTFTAAPTGAVPNGSFATYDTGGVYRLYVMVNGTWRYGVLT